MESKKNPKADLGKYRWALIGLGLCVASAVTTAAIEIVEFKATIKTVEEEKVVVEDINFNYDLEEETPPEPEDPPEVEPPPAPPDEIEVTEDEDKQTKVDLGTKNVPPPPPPPPPPPKKVTIVDFPQQMAEFPGGNEAMYKYLGEHMSYPRMAKEASIQGKVFVQFVVWKDGTIGQVKILKGIGGGCDEEAVRVVKSMPKWAPAQQAGQKVSSRFMLPVVFRLDP